MHMHLLAPFYNRKIHDTINRSAAIAQLVERIHGKDEVPGSNPGRGSIIKTIPEHLPQVFFEYINML